MADKHWYGLKIRPGFEVVAAQKLRKLNFEVFVHERKITKSPESQHEEYPPAICLYCRFALENRQTVIGIPGVLDIIGTPNPTHFDSDVFALQSAIGSRP